MRLEIIPLIIAAIVGLLGGGLVFDAWTPDDILVRRERRRSPRIDRNRRGEGTVGLGILCMAAAIAGRDSWRYSVVVVMAGTLLLLIGTWANRSFLGQMIGNRGPLRRREAPRE